MKLITRIIKAPIAVLIMALIVLLCASSTKVQANAIKDIGKFVTAPPQQQVAQVIKIVNKAGQVVNYTQDAIVSTTEMVLIAVDDIIKVVNTTKKAISDIKISIDQLKAIKTSHDAMGPVFTMIKGPLAIHTDALEVLIGLVNVVSTFSKKFIRPFDENAHAKVVYNFSLPVLNVHTSIYDVTQKINQTVNILESATRNVQTHSLNMIEMVKASPLSHKKF